MHIKCWGSRGSIPVSGPGFVKYGGDTTCLEIRTQSNDTIIIDAGTGIRQLGRHLIHTERSLCHFLLTHAHWDHIMGFPFFKPLYRENTSLRIFQCSHPDHFIESTLTKIMSPPNFPIRYADIASRISYENRCSNPFEIGSVTIETIPLSHPNGACGYKFTEQNKSFVFLTDNELGFIHPGGLSADAYAEFCADVDLLIHDAEYTPQEYEIYKGWGHSTYAEVLELAIRAGVRKLGLHHLNAERTDPEMDDIVENCAQTIAEKNQKLECFAVGYQTEILL